MPTRWKTDVMLALFLCALTLLLSWLPVIRELDQRLTDRYFRLQRSSSASEVVVVMIDDASLQQFGRWPWKRNTLARMIDDISSQKPKVIGVDILLSEPQDNANDAALLEAIKRAGNVVLVDKVAAFPDGPRWIEPLPKFAAAAAVTGHAQAVLDSDGICRRFPPEQLSLSGRRYAFAVEVANLVSSKGTSAFLAHYDLRYNYAAEELVVAHPRLIPIFYRSRNSPSLSATEVLGPNVRSRLKDKIVLVGFGPSELGDRITTPISRGLPTPGVEVHAQIVQAILDGRFLDAIPLWGFACIALLECFAALRFFRIWRSWKTVPTIAALSLAIFCAGWVAFSVYGTSIPIGSLLCAVLLTPLTLHGLELAAVEESVSHQVRFLQRWFVPSEEQRGDLTARVNQLADLQEELGKRFEFFTTLLEATRDLVAVFDSDGTLLFANNAFRAAWQPYLPGSLEEARAKLAECTDAPLVQHEGIVEGEVRFERDLYSVRLVPLPATSLVLNGGTLLSMTSLAMRVERDRAREESLSFVTHELRTPLSAIQNFAEVMLRYPKSSTSARAPETILRESKRLLLLINSYLDVLRTDSGARPLSSETVLLRPLVERVFETLTPLAQAFSIRLKLECAEAVTVVGDEPLLIGAVLNVVANAIKYGCRESEVLVSASIDEGILRLNVHNVGAHISPDDGVRIFDPFVRGQVESPQPSSGLGLSIVKRVIEKHGGTVTIESDPSVGTTFSLRLPRAALASGALAS